MYLGLSLTCACSPDTLSLTLFCKYCRYVLSLFTTALNTNTLFQVCLLDHAFLAYSSQRARFIYTPPPIIDIHLEERNAFLDYNIHHGFRTGYLDSPQAAGRRLFS
jgi:hypothetical protein